MIVIELDFKDISVMCWRGCGYGVDRDVIYGCELGVVCISFFGIVRLVVDEG